MRMALLGSIASSIQVASAAPVNTVAPVVSGGKSTGLTFSTTTGTWTGSPSGYTYQWTRGGSNIGSATASTYVMVAADIGTAIGCTVTATNGTGSTPQASNTITGISWSVSVQQVSITIATLSASNTASISAVSANAFILFQGFTTSDSNTAEPNVEIGRIELTNSTTVTASRGSAIAAQTVTVNAVVIDPGADLVESVQSGTVTLTAQSSNTATITSVDTSRSALFSLGNSTTEVVSTNNTWKGGVSLTNATTVTATVNTGGVATTTFGYIVVQFKAQSIQSLQNISAAFSSTTSATNDTTITAIATANSAIAYGGVKCNSSTFSNNQNYGQITSTTNVRWTRSGTSSATITPFYAVIEFIPGVLKSLQRGGISVASATSNTATISAVDTSKAIVSYTGQTATATAPREVWGNITLTNSTTVTAAKNTAGTTTSVIGYEVWEFN